MPLDGARGGVQRVDVVIGRGHVERVADDQRERLLPLLDRRIELREIDGVGEAELRRVGRRDLGQGRVADAVDRPSERPPAAARSARGGVRSHRRAGHCSARDDRQGEDRDLRAKPRCKLSASPICFRPHGSAL